MSATCFPMLERPRSRLGCEGGGEGRRARPKRDSRHPSHCKRAPARVVRARPKRCLRLGEREIGPLRRQRACEYDTLGVVQRARLADVLEQRDPVSECSNAVGRQASIVKAVEIQRLVDGTGDGTAEHKPDHALPVGAGA